MILDNSHTYRGEFNITELDGVFTGFLAGMAIASTNDINVCKMIIDADYPVKIENDVAVNAASNYFEQMDFDDNSTGPILGWEDDDSDLRHNGDLF